MSDKSEFKPCNCGEAQETADLEWGEVDDLEIARDGVEVECQIRQYSGDGYLCVLRIARGTEYDTSFDARVLESDRGYSETSDDQVRTIVFLLTEGKRFDFASLFPGAAQLVDGRGRGKRWKRFNGCKSKDYNQNCVDCGAYLNRASDYFNCDSSFSYCVSPGTCVDTSNADDKS